MRLPLHERIRRDIESDILAGVLAPGDRLPVEHVLMARYGCSRMTVSKALTALAGAGLVDRRKRAGSIVARPRVHSMVLDIPDLEAEVTNRGQSYRYELRRRAVRPARRSSPEERALAGRGRVIVLTGVHLADGSPLAAETRFINLTSVPEAESFDFSTASPGAWLLRHVPWTEAETRIAAVPAGDSARDLKVSASTACLLVERRTWRAGEGVTLVRQHFLGSAYDLVARFGPSRGLQAPGRTSEASKRGSRVMVPA